MPIVCSCRGLWASEVGAATKEACAHGPIENPKTLPKKVVEQMNLNWANEGCDIKRVCVRRFVDKVFKTAGSLDP